jgi:hypothetical protein
MEPTSELATTVSRPLCSAAIESTTCITRGGDGVHKMRACTGGDIKRGYDKDAYHVDYAVCEPRKGDS